MEIHKQKHWKYPSKEFKSALAKKDREVFVTLSPQSALSIAQRFRHGVWIYEAYMCPNICMISIFHQKKSLKVREIAIILRADHAPRRWRFGLLDTKIFTQIFFKDQFLPNSLSSFLSIAKIQLKTNLGAISTQRHAFYANKHFFESTNSTRCFLRRSPLNQ